MSRDALRDAVPLGEIARALVIMLRHHGDVLLASPVLSALKAQAPAAEIDALVYDDTAPMLEGHPALARLHVVGRKWKKAGFLARLASERRLYGALRARGYDLIVHLTEQPRGAWLARALGARYSVAPVAAGRGAFWAGASRTCIRAPATAAATRSRPTSTRCGASACSRAWRSAACASSRARRREARIDGLLASEGLQAREFVHIHPASRWSFKCWTAERNAELIDRLATAAPRRPDRGAGSRGSALDRGDTCRERNRNR